MSLQSAPAAAIRPLRIVVVDDHPTILRMVETLIKQEPHMKVVGDASDGAAALPVVEEFRPDVVILNVIMPKMNGFEAARRIRQKFPHMGIVIMSTHKDEQFIKQAEECGASAFVNKSEATQELVKAIEAAGKGEKFISLD